MNQNTNYFIQLADGAYVWKISRGNYFSAPKCDKSCCILTKEKAKRYAKRLSSMDVPFVLVAELQNKTN